jgi:hypothetical protein
MLIKHILVAFVKSESGGKNQTKSGIMEGNNRNLFLVWLKGKIFLFEVRRFNNVNLG